MTLQALEHVEIVKLSREISAPHRRLPDVKDEL